MSLNDRLNKQNAPFREAEGGNATRLGIIALSLLLIGLVAFFFWYNNRSLVAGLPNGSAPASEADQGGLFSRIFSSSPTPAAVLPDADRDGLDDASEAALGTDPAKADTDGDGLTDREEAKVYKTDPRKPDTDGDGMKDGDEIRARRDPLDSSPAAIWPPRPAASDLKS